MSDVSDVTVPVSVTASVTSVSPEPSPVGPPGHDLESHWQVIADWPAGRQLYACYATAVDQPDLRAYIADFQRELAHLPGLDVIRPEWLHMTIQGIRFADEVETRLVDEVAERLGEELQAWNPLRLVVERPLVTGDSVLMPVRPVASVAALRDEIRRVLAQTPETEDLYVLPGQDDGFDPHFSIAYANRAFGADHIEAALARCRRGPLEITLRSVSMLTLVREQPRYHWVDERPVRLGR